MVEEPGRAPRRHSCAVPTPTLRSVGLDTAEARDVPGVVDFLLPKDLTAVQQLEYCAKRGGARRASSPGHATVCSSAIRWRSSSPSHAPPPRTEPRWWWYEPGTPWPVDELARGGSGGPPGVRLA